MPVNIRIDIYARVDGALLLLLWFSCDYFVKLHNLRLHTSNDSATNVLSSTGHRRQSQEEDLLLRLQAIRARVMPNFFTSVRKKRKFIIVTDVRFVRKSYNSSVHN